MNERPTLLKPVGPASLAGEEDFQFGDILVRPSLREVEANGAKESLEPRVMQVLVALARANGAVVSRDDLIRQCWGGRVVGEDAINRCVSKIRQLAELGGGDAFEIDTIPRVGYRLREPATRSGGSIFCARGRAGKRARFGFPARRTTRGDAWSLDSCGHRLRRDCGGAGRSPGTCICIARRNGSWRNRICRLFRHRSSSGIRRSRRTGR
ncbi:MAG TPA: winged helix-turn-helix domain-containing protein [Rhizomicrobium sp.]|nr:winged helix-turn-helix domain-containing protein [Rhizomicrobium sp.]